MHFLLFVLALMSSEKRLHSMNQLVNHPNSVQYFWPDQPVGHIQDDHIPFLNRGIHSKWHWYHNYEYILYIVLFWWVILILCLPVRCPCPPPDPLPLPVRVAHVWWQRAEPWSLHYSEPQQDPAALCSGVPRRQTCQRFKLFQPFKPTECPVKPPAFLSTIFFLLMLHRSKDLQLLFYKNTLHLLFKYQQYGFVDLMIEMWGWN